MRDSNRHSQPEAEAQPRHDKHVLRMVERLQWIRGRFSDPLWLILQMLFISFINKLNTRAKIRNLYHNCK